MTPFDLKMNWMLSKAKDFIGKRSLSRSVMVASKPKQLVGLLSCDGRRVLTEGSQLLDDIAVPLPVSLVGPMTSSYYSANLSQLIALGLLVNGHARMGDQLFARASSGPGVAVEVSSSVFNDPKGARQNV